MIVDGLNEIQKRVGYLPKDELKLLAERLDVPLYRIQDVASSFPHYRTSPPAEMEVHVCRDMACHHRGAAAVTAELADRCRKSFGELRVHVSGTSCLGRCDRPVASTLTWVRSGRPPREYVFTHATADRLFANIKDALGSVDKPQGDHDTLDPVSEPTWAKLPWLVDPYKGGVKKYEAVRRHVHSTPPARVDGEDYAKTVERHPVVAGLRAANLLGMGGAGVPAAQKWKDVAVARGDEKYIVCNADESEPSTFKDRELLLRTPHLVLEGVILAGLLTGATRGYIYIRHEYEEQIARMRETIREAERAGACGGNVYGSGRAFPVEVFVSPGGYICGEQSALIEAMSDRRAEPRNRPPDLLTNGLWDKPTLVSNVETFAWVPSIIVRTDEATKPGEWYANQGVNGFKGRRFFSVCGDVRRPGVYEVPIGVTLRELIFDCCLGMADGGEVVAVAPSGPSGGFLPPKIPVALLPKRLPDEWKARLAGAAELDILDLELDLNRFREFNLMLGAGLAVYGTGTDVVREAVNATEFFRNESCGKCVPCRIGSQKLVDVGTSLLANKYSPPTFKPITDAVRELGPIMEVTSICGLGAVASGPMMSLLKYFPREVERYLEAN